MNSVIRSLKVSTKNTSLAILSGIILTGCSMFGGAKDKVEEPASSPNVGSGESDLAKEDKKKSISDESGKSSLNYGAESSKESLFDCAVQTAPEAGLGIGLGIMIAHPLAWPIGLLYAGGEYYVCYRDQQYDRPGVIDGSELAKEIKRDTNEQIQKTMQPLQTKVQIEVERLKDQSNRLVETLETAGEAERESIKRLGNKVLREIYTEYQTIQDAEVVIDEEVIEERVIETKKRLQK